MVMKIKRIHIQNFKGCKDKEVTFSDYTAIKGMNGCGKTTIADAVAWVLFNKDNAGNTTFDIRPKDKDGNDIDFVDIQVELEIEIDAKPVVIVKTQKQKWVKKRGSEEKTFEGNQNSYEVNTIPKTEKVFKDYIDSIVPEEVFKFVSNTNAFMSQKPADRRNTLFKLVSGVTTDDVLASDEKLSGLKDQLTQFTPEEMASRDKKALFEMKKRLDEIPARIDEVSKNIVEQDYSEQEKELFELRKEIESISENAENNTAAYERINKLKDQIAKGNSILEDIKRDETSLVRENRKETDEKLSIAKRNLEYAKGHVRSMFDDIEFKKGELMRNKEKLAALRDQYRERKTVEFDLNDTICPTCGQQYPEDKKEEMISAFEERKKKDLDNIGDSGSRISNIIKDLETRLLELESEYNEKTAEITSLESKVAQLNEEASSLPMEAHPEQTERYIDTTKKIEEVKAKLEQALNAISNEEEKKRIVKERKSEIQRRIDEVNQAISGRFIVENSKQRVEELKTEQKEVSARISTIEQELYLLEQFEKARVNLLSEKINSHFKVVKWKLFERQINGGYNPVCEPLINGQAYNGALNSGHKILAELDIINALQGIYEANVPVFLDNAERINDYNIPSMSCQLITLSVSYDKEMMIENK